MEVEEDEAEGEGALEEEEEAPPPRLRTTPATRPYLDAAARTLPSLCAELAGRLLRYTVHRWTTAACAGSEGRRCGEGRSAALRCCSAASADESAAVETFPPFLRMSAA